MDEQEAYSFLFQITATINADRATHIKIQQALDTFLKLIQNLAAQKEISKEPTKGLTKK